MKLLGWLNKMIKKGTVKHRNCKVFGPVGAVDSMGVPYGATGKDYMEARLKASEKRVKSVMGGIELLNDKPTTLRSPTPGISERVNDIVRNTGFSSTIEKENIDSLGEPVQGCKTIKSTIVLEYHTDGKVRQLRIGTICSNYSISAVLSILWSCVRSSKYVQPVDPFVDVLTTPYKDGAILDINTVKATLDIREIMLKRGHEWLLERRRIAFISGMGSLDEIIGDIITRLEKVQFVTITCNWKKTTDPVAKEMLKSEGEEHQNDISSNTSDPVTENAKQLNDTFKHTGEFQFILPTGARNIEKFNQVVRDEIWSSTNFKQFMQWRSEELKRRSTEFWLYIYRNADNLEAVRDHLDRIQKSLTLLKEFVG